jgi:hypothetical protein
MTVQLIDERVTLDARPQTEEMRDFARVLRRALLMIVKYLEIRYRLCD